jgi:hypothetical protein
MIDSMAGSFRAKGGFGGGSITHDPKAFAEKRVPHLDAGAPDRIAMRRHGQPRIPRILPEPRHVRGRLISADLGADRGMIGGAALERAVAGSTGGG